MQLEIKDGVTTLSTRSNREAKVLTELYFGSMAVETLKTPPSRQEKGRRKNRVNCPHGCGRYKVLKLHMIMKHDKRGQVGWHKTGIVPATLRRAQPHPELIEA